MIMDCGNRGVLGSEVVCAMTAGTRGNGTVVLHKTDGKGGLASV